ncbi:MAG: hypothetical protein RL260_2614, partial [Pseudomonadota bacterium]
TLLPPDALTGLRIGLSLSDSPDLDRLGLTHQHLEQAMRELVRTVLVSGGTLAYGGHLRSGPQSLTDPMMDEVQHYASTRDRVPEHDADKPLWLCLAWQEHRCADLQRLQATRQTLGLHGAIKYIGWHPDGAEVDPWAGRGHDAISDPVAPGTPAQGLTALRRFMARQTQARVLLGGKRTAKSVVNPEGYQGDQPGLLEEALCALDAGQPVYLAGGFGGITLDMVNTIDHVIAAPLLPPSLVHDAKTTAALQVFHAALQDRGWFALNNGLTDAQNRQLATTHRPSEIAALVSYGLGQMGR